MNKTVLIVLTTTLAACGLDSIETVGPQREVSEPTLSRQLGTGDILALYGAEPGGTGRHEGACRSAAHRGFDFWLGQWRIVSAADPSTPQGQSRIDSDLNGCAVVENYSGAGGAPARSLNLYDRVSATWSQTYIDDVGFTLRMDGKRRDRVLTMTSGVRSIPAIGIALTDTIHWRAEQGGTVRQTWLQSTDGGLTYVNVFDGRYLPDPGAALPPEALRGLCLARPGYRPGDGLAGTYSVSANGIAVGTSTIRSTLGTCLLDEVFVATDGLRSRGFIAFDRFVGEWFWTRGDTRGRVVRLVGKVSPGGFVMVGSATPRPEVMAQVRVTFQGVGSSQMTLQWEVEEAPGIWSALVTIVYDRVA